jgi:hypothetical protein
MTRFWSWAEKNVSLRSVFCGLKDGNDGRLGGSFVDVGFGWFFFFFFFALQHALDEQGDGAFGSCGLGDIGARSEDTEGRVDGDLFYGLGFGFGEGLWFREVEAGDLKAVEEEAGAAGVDVVGGDALEDFADRGLDGGAVFR